MRTTSKTMTKTHNRDEKVILILDDHSARSRKISEYLQSAGYQVVPAADRKKALTLIRRQVFDLAVINDQHNGEDGFLLMDELRETQHGLPTIIVAGQGSIERAVEVMKHGACHYLVGPVDGPQLAGQIEQCLGLRQKEPVGRPKPSSPQPELAPSCARIIAHSDVMKDVLAKIGQVAVSDANVYIEGESGTGKELVARCLHGASRRKDGPFIAINCAAIPENLLESELLGYEKGAFTGADGRRDGLFAQAHGGTFFLDELAELPLSMQAKLLRILEEREFYPLGSNRKVTVDVRIIAASNRRLEQQMKEGRFREDLYYRVRVIPITLPPLRERKEDILPLAHYFLEQFSRDSGKSVQHIAPAAARKLMAADWPGNIRELENTIEYAVALADGDTITPELVSGSLSAENDTPPLRHAKADFEKDYLIQILERHRGIVSRAASEAGKHRADFYALLRKHNLSVNDFRTN
ncbi:sigma-54-dependent transcriptional regulator [Desulfofustis glycolicus]|uniref:Two-component system, NtrC family, response regulator GlrR n=1 Tax=Desulfofustis glycolicus DSM 9705 TaxID=1121409 RepID=A0A1M5S2L7_9BACT|nr:sigma-54 dependent transcriptional regulator [Desulfofustis glycolicus]MCB2216256.1 sigma-54 dependent transcriptional regulator [Desulfobulbaceae bacterium]SHH32691.1 two-component system, NtrC family, response regulator GlrR [Desulfofustis glycolicus DSM 9705]